MISVIPRFTGRAGFEAAMNPVILFGHGAHGAFNESVHAPRIRFDIIGRKICPRLAQFDDITPAIRQYPGNTGDYDGSGGSRKT